MENFMCPFCKKETIPISKENWINKVCELNLQNEREYNRMSYCVACDKFKLNPKIKKRLLK